MERTGERAVILAASERARQRCERLARTARPALDGAINQFRKSTRRDLEDRIEAVRRRTPRRPRQAPRRGEWPRFERRAQADVNRLLAAAPPEIMRSCNGSSMSMASELGLEPDELRLIDRLVLSKRPEHLVGQLDPPASPRALLPAHDCRACSCRPASGSPGQRRQSRDLDGDPDRYRGRRRRGTRPVAAVGASLVVASTRPGPACPSLEAAGRGRAQPLAQRLPPAHRTMLGGRPRRGRRSAAATRRGMLARKARELTAEIERLRALAETVATSTATGREQSRRSAPRCAWSPPTPGGSFHRLHTPSLDVALPPTLVAPRQSAIADSS